jgi:hypothetical protein
LQSTGVAIRATNYRIGCGLYDRPHHGVDPISLDIEATGKHIEIAAFDEAVKAKFVEESNVCRTLPIRREQASEAKHSPWLLRTGRYWAYSRRTAEQCDKLAPSDCHFKAAY